MCLPKNSVTFHYKERLPRTQNILWHEEDMHLSKWFLRLVFLVGNCFHCWRGRDMMTPITWGTYTQLLFIVTQLAQDLLRQAHLGDLFVPYRGKVLKRVNPAVTQFWFLPHGAPLTAAGWRDQSQSQTGYERALYILLPSLPVAEGRETWQSHGDPLLTPRARKAQCVRRTNYSLEELPLLKQDHSPTTAPGLCAPGTGPAAVALSLPLPPCSPGERHGDRADTEQACGRGSPFHKSSVK